MDQILESLSALLIPITDAEGRPDTLGGIMWCVFFGVVLVLISVLWQNATLGKAIRVLREKGAADEGSAVPLSELGKLPASAYKGSQTLFGKVDGEEGTCLFLPEKSAKKANALLKTASAPLWLTLLELAGFYLVLLFIYHLLPWVLSIF